jgi:putative transposase
MTTEPATYPGYRFPAEIITHAVWLYHVFSLSLRDIDLILAERASRSPTRAISAGTI